MENGTIYNDEYNDKMMNVNDKVVTASVQDDDEDDFDRLLDEFLRTGLEENTVTYNDSNEEVLDDDDCLEADDDNDEDDNDDELFPEFKYGSVSFELGGNTYTIPKQPHSCKASRLVFINNSYDNQQLVGEPVVFATSHGRSTCVTFAAYSIKGFKEKFLPAVYVYKAYEAYPVGRETLLYHNDEDALMLSSEDILGTLPNGNYFFCLWGVEVEGLSALYRNCDGCCCIPFVKVDGDVELPSVNLDRAEVALDVSGRFLDVSLGFDRMVGRRYGYSLFLYNCNCNLVARSAAFAWDKFSKRKRKNLEARLTSECALFGEYQLFVVQNDTPCWRVGFSIDNGVVVSTEISSIRQFGEEYLLLNELEKRTAWHSFRESCATVDMKKFYLSRYAREYLNRKRRSMGLKAIEPVSNFVYNGGCSAKELKALDMMSRMFWNISCFDSADCISLTDSSNLNSVNDINELFSSCDNKCIALYNILALLSNGSHLINKMLESMAECSSLAVCLIGSQQEVNQLFELFPQLRQCFPAANCISNGNMHAGSYVAQVANGLRSYGLKLSPDAQRVLVDVAGCAERGGWLNGLTLADVSEFVKTGIVENFVERTLASLDKDRLEDKDFHSTVEACDIDKDGVVKGSEREFEDSMKQLNMMVGLNAVKDNITRNFNRLKMNAERRRLGLKVKSGECHHMIFTGNPGTGKTTVARMMGRIYRSLGLLAKGDVVFTDRSRIVGRYIGETERNMQRILHEAKGNILFIDEAYTLCDSADERRDFGYRAIECLLTVMAQENSDMIVIFAGYAKEMDMMMRCNQGLSGRFPYKFEFEDYSADELMQIAELKLSQEDYELTSEARALLQNTIEETLNDKEWDFCNARWIEQYVNNGIIPAQGERLMQCGGVKSRDDYRCVTAEDVSAAYALRKPARKVGRTYREIGFTA